jgi:hypothetical protein
MTESQKRAPSEYGSVFWMIKHTSIIFLNKGSPGSGGTLEIWICFLDGKTYVYGNLFIVDSEGSVFWMVKHTSIYIMNKGSPGSGVPFKIWICFLDGKTYVYGNLFIVDF